LARGEVRGGARRRFLSHFAAGGSKRRVELVSLSCDGNEQENEQKQEQEEKQEEKQEEETRGKGAKLRAFRLEKTSDGRWGAACACGV
jgi:hypothetical protein